jgi:hypothetical protein
MSRAYNRMRLRGSAQVTRMTAKSALIPRLVHENKRLSSCHDCHTTPRLGGSAYCARCLAHAPRNSKAKRAA